MTEQLMFDGDNDTSANIPITPCFWCSRLISLDPPECKAFSVIPAEILSGENPHVQSVQGDNGITFERIA